ncbi:MAG: DUF3524 domain-containing protein [Acidimicrobiales bacterium]|jgi:glycosyltransferase involved in cell wall biosynthesis|nr:hypothetical protein [Acidimicrobiaceae bacterium]MDP6161427.1 DUF3524 domain-containing protein [Acidimicrobiales bacterium]HJL91991.1 DUF3524 domain-containing protein [Acidimicrobiales bacterium]HJO41481.1 DUF3524 domain-containing protein [Acidimicrobiales bacterium]|tara:strand:+ start:19308 stop:20420 length:1113 start_codon:yes stop_codon:yes gene_type:complete
MATKLKVLLLEPFHSGSHQTWAEGLIKHTRHEISFISHPGSFWRWRVRGSALTMAEKTQEIVNDKGKPDIVLASGMIDLAAWLGFTKRFIGDPPVVLYQHENQLTYPVSSGQSPDNSMKFVNWKNMAIADQIWLNSNFHKESLIEALPEFLSNVPDLSHSHLLEQAIDKMHVVPVGVELSEIVSSDSVENPPLVLWNHRWEYDKNPEAFITSLIKLKEEGVRFNFAVTGENSPEGSEAIKSQFGKLSEFIVSSGYLPRSEYISLLSKTDVVVSSAMHEFFGISIVEALSAGAIPVLPKRLSYPEIVPEEWHDFVFYSNEKMTDRLREVLNDIDNWKKNVAGLGEAMRRFDWVDVIKCYDDKLEEIVSDGL